MDVPWSTVEEFMSMAKHALDAKQQTVEALLQQVEEHSQKENASELLQRANRAEVDSGCLLGELQALISAKAELHAQRADLDRANALLVAERDLLCEQLEVAPTNVNLCQEVQKVLSMARKAKGLEGQLRMLARCHKELLLQLEASREDAARTTQHWQVCEQEYLAREQVVSSYEALVGSPSSSHGHFLPPTPPGSENAGPGPAVVRMRRSHSLDSGLNSLTGLLDQLALGQLGSDDGDSLECGFETRDYESWMLCGASFSCRARD
eukprot:gene2240-2552_t